jgi:tetratricopeptide (TPR) repeat protein
MAFQVVGRLPDAFKAAQEIEAIANQDNDLGMKCDALTSQGQILLDSADPMGAFEKFEEAQTIANALEDKRRYMNVLGALGNYNLTMASHRKAGAYFDEAREIAQKLGDRSSEIGYLGNLGTILEWNGEYTRAAVIFEEVLAYLQETGDQDAEVQALRHLVQVYKKLNKNEKTITYALRGIELTENTEADTVFLFFDSLILAKYRLNKFEEAHAATEKAIGIARAAKNREREVDFLLSLGESYMLANMLEQALEVYMEALDGTQRLQRLVDRAYLLGRVGVILAESDRADEALTYHEQAIAQAKRHEIPELEGEQSAMLAMAYFDKGELDQAQAYCNQAIEIFTKANFPDQAENARQLLTEIDDAREK